MNQMSKVLKGNKISHSHSTFSNLSGIVIKTLKNCSEVSKIILGVIKPSHSDKRRLKVTEENGNVKIQCRDTSSIQVLYVHGVNKLYVEEKLKEVKEEL